MEEPVVAGAAVEKILQPRRRPAQQRSRERYSRILVAARRVLVDYGFESFTFDEVAKRAGVLGFGASGFGDSSLGCCQRSE